MPPAGRPSSVQARPIYEILQDDLKAVVSIQTSFTLLYIKWKVNSSQ